MCKTFKAPFLKKGELSDDLSKVGPGKPIGYDNLRLYADSCADVITAIQEKLRSRGLKTLLLKENDCSMRAGALYAYDEQALSALLKKRASLLAAHHWPTEPEAFIRKIAIEWAPEKTPLFDTIADTFNNKAHPGRTDVEVPDQHPHFSPQYLACLKQREANPESGIVCTPP